MWPYTEFNLDELGELGRGKSKHRPRNDKKLFGGEYPFIQTGDVKAANLHVKEFSETVIIPFLIDAKSRDHAAINGGLPPLALCGLL